MSSVYLEYAPNPRLKDFVACYWSLKTTENANLTNHRVLPDGCIDLVFDNFSGTSGVMVGSMTSAVAVNLPPMSRFFGVRFRPGGAASFIKISLKEITDAQLNLIGVWRDADAELSTISVNAEFRQQISIIENFLERKFIGGNSLNPKITAAVDIFISSEGKCSIDTLSRKLEISRQHLNHIFTEVVGLNLKTFARITRFQFALKRARRSPLKDWADLALESGYYDQAHFISEFKSITKLTPTKFFGREI